MGREDLALGGGERGEGGKGFRKVEVGVPIRIGVKDG